MSEHDRSFIVGLPSRQDAAAAERARAAATHTQQFTPAQLIARIEEAFAGGPRHFSPQDRDANPTAGWDMLDPELPEDFVDPVEEARAAGFEEGLAAARAAAAGDAERDRALMAALVAELGDAGRIDREAMARRLRQTVLALVERVVGEAGVSAALLAARVEGAADLLADAQESAMLRVNPEDVALLEGKLPATIFAVGDAAVARGSFVLESASTIVEDGPALWLEQLGQAIDGVALPAC